MSVGLGADVSAGASVGVRVGVRVGVGAAAGVGGRGGTWVGGGSAGRSASLWLAVSQSSRLPPCEIECILPIMSPQPDERRETLRRFGYAVRSKPAEPRTDTRPGGLVAGSHSRSYLPHVKAAGGTYFVTFRLDDSLPREVVRRLKAMATAAAEQATDEEARLAADREYFREFEGALDASHGACWLRRPEIAGVVSGALRFFDGTRYRLRAWVVMPNHVHVVLTPLPGFALSAVLHSWKSFTAKDANRLLPEKSVRELWQRESYDRLCRDAAETERWISYVERNPVKAKLCAKIEDWLWSSAHPGGKRDACDTAGEDACATPPRDPAP